MAKILLFSDIHIAQHKRSFKRLQDCLSVLEWVFQTAKDRQVSAIVFAGDLFHDREKIDILTYHLTFDVFFKNQEIPVYLLLGNHDLWFYEKWDIHSVKPLSALNNINIIDKSCTKSIEKYNIDFIPFTFNPIQYIPDLNSEILISHLAIHGARNNAHHSEVVIENDGEMTIVGPNQFSKWDKVFLGHYHEAQIIDNMEYIGSPLELSWGERNQEKHLILFDLSTGKQEYINNNFSPKHLILEEKIDNVQGNFIRFVSKNITDNIELRKELLKENPETLEIINLPKECTETFIKDATLILQNHEKMLEEYIKNSNIGNLKSERLIELSKEVCKI